MFRSPRYTSDKPNIAPRIEPAVAIEELGLPRSSGYSHVTFDESAMLEVMAKRTSRTRMMCTPPRSGGEEQHQLRE